MGQKDSIVYQVYCALPGGERQVLIALRENGWVNISEQAAPVAMPLLWQAMPQLIEPHLLPDEKLQDLSQEEIDRIGAKISEFMLPGLRHALGLYNRNLANSFFE